MYDPIIGRFGQADPVTESPFSTQGWNRYSYVGNSPTNFTDPSGYCFMGCFWKGIFKGLGNFLRNNPIVGDIFQIVATMACLGNPVCGMAVAAATSFVITGLTSGNLGQALRAGFISLVTAIAFNAVGNATAMADGSHALSFGSSNHLANIAGHAAVGCASAVASGGKCGPGALSGAAGSFASPLLAGANLGLVGNTAAHALVGGLASVAGGGKFGNGAVTAAFGYLFNQMAGDKPGIGHNSQASPEASAPNTDTRLLQLWMLPAAIVVYSGYYFVDGMLNGFHDSAALYNQGMQEGAAKYPGKVGTLQWHHIDPMYMGGDPKGPGIYLDAAYHQMITNAFRSAYAYKQGPLPLQSRLDIMARVYAKYPLPK